MTQCIIYVSCYNSVMIVNGQKAGPVEHISGGELLHDKFTVHMANSDKLPMSLEIHGILLKMYYY